MAPTASKVILALRSPFVWVPAVILAVATSVFRWTDLDVAMVQPFYAHDVSNSQMALHWPLKDVQPWKGLYDWGEYPALLIGGGGLVVWLTSFAWKRLERWRNYGFFLALLLIIGPGIIINVLMKPFWARPRPNAIVLFGGPSKFLPVWQIGQGKDDWSFPSGHAAAEIGRAHV